MSEANLSFLITDIRVDSQNIFHQTRDFIGAKKTHSSGFNFTNSEFYEFCKPPFHIQMVYYC